jgi:hypothetical protein
LTIDASIFPSDFRTTKLFVLKDNENEIIRVQHHLTKSQNCIPLFPLVTTTIIMERIPVVYRKQTTKTILESGLATKDAAESCTHLEYIQRELIHVPITATKLHNLLMQLHVQDP